MAKSKVNRSQLIRDYKAKNPTLKPQALSDLIKKEAGLSLAPNYISMILSNARKKGTIGKRGRPKGSTKAATEAKVSAPVAAGSVNLEKLLLVKKFVSQMGSVEKAKAAMSAYAALVD